MTSADVPAKNCQLHFVGLNNYRNTLELSEADAIEIINLFLDMQRRVSIPLASGWITAFNFEHIISINMIRMEDM